MKWDEANKPYDCSQIKKFMKCPFTYYLSYGFGLNTPNTDGDYHLEYGKCFHEFIEAHYKKLPYNLDFIWAGYSAPIGETHKTAESGIALCKAYIEHWKHVDKEFNIVSVEEQLEIAGTVKPFISKVDTVLERDGQYYVLEHKTTGVIRQNYFDQFTQDIQMEAECLAVKQKYGNCSGVWVGASAVYNYKRKTEGKLPGIHCDFSRRLFNKTPNELVDALYTINHWIGQIETAKQTGAFVKAKGGYNCAGYKVCKFIDACTTSTGMELDKQTIENRYIETNPFEYLED